jgi:hypothetical protein
MLAPEDRKGADLVPVHAVGRLVQDLLRLDGDGSCCCRSETLLMPPFLVAWYRSRAPSTRSSRAAVCPQRLFGLAPRHRAAVLTLVEARAFQAEGTALDLGDRRPADFATQRERPVGRRVEVDRPFAGWWHAKTVGQGNGARRGGGAR